MILDFFVRKRYYIDHLAPLWNALPANERGAFWLPPDCYEYARQRLDTPVFQPYDADVNHSGANPVVTCGYGDAVKARTVSQERIVILMEHGVGLTFGKASYADGVGQRIHLDMFPLPNQHTADRFPAELDKPHPVVGIPKMDKYASLSPHPMPARPVIGLAFHHGSQHSAPPEVGSAWEHWAEVLPELARRYKVIGHMHPIAAPDAMEAMLKAGIEIVPDFDDVMKRADIYLNDCSSTLYEFCVTGKPVIILNAPWFRRSVEWGLRFWDYTDIGPLVDHDFQLFAAIERAIQNPDEYRVQRQRAVRDLFPNLGTAAEKTLTAIREFINGQPRARMSPRPIPMNFSAPCPVVPARKPLVIRSSRERGIVYMCFGDKARVEMAKSIASLRAVGSTLPVCVVGNVNPASLNGTQADIAKVILWDGESPFDSEQTKNFQFRAGRVKPGLYNLSPFKQSMYVDCDTEFLADPEPGFEFLGRWDFAIAQERLTVSQLYNKPRAGWQHNMDERDATVKAFGGNGDFPFVNSGVFFWNKNKHVEELFQLWSEEWHKWQNWDEQLALMRAMNRSRARVFVLAELWNCPHREESKIIYHAYGRGMARINIEKETQENG